MYCGKQQTKVTLPHEQSCDSEDHRPQALVPVPLNAMEKGLRKKFPRFKPRNPLKSLDSDERIQGNPRQSNTHQRGFSQRKGQGQENPNGSTGPMSRPVAAKEPNPLHPNAKRP